MPETAWRSSGCLLVSPCGRWQRLLASLGGPQSPRQNSEPRAEPPEVGVRENAGVSLGPLRTTVVGHGQARTLLML